MERPILMSTPMVQAIMDGRKTQTRRIIKPHGKAVAFNIVMWMDGSNKWPLNLDADERVISDMDCPYGRRGDVLWVRETFQILPPNMVFYKADKENKATGNWKPSIFMPKEACRIKLMVKDIRVERLQDISEEDALEEGISSFTKDNVGFKFGLDGWHWSYQTGFPFMCSDAKLAYSNLWESINGEGSWEKNPWVWVIEFEYIK